MIWSGLLIYWANSIYTLTIFGYELFKFFPKGFYEYLDVPFRLAEGLQLHFFLMWLFIVNGVVMSHTRFFRANDVRCCPFPARSNALCR